MRFLRQAHAKRHRERDQSVLLGLGERLAGDRLHLVRLSTFPLLYDKQVVNERNKDGVFRPVLG